MKKYLLTNKAGEIKMVCDDPMIEFDQEVFDMNEVEINEEEVENLANNKYQKYKDKKLEFHEGIVKAMDVKEKIKKAKNIDDLKDFLIEALTKQ